MGWRSILFSCGKVNVRFVIFGVKNARADGTASQLNPFVNLNEVSLGHRGSGVDRIPRKDIVSEDTSLLSNPPMDSSTTRAAYLLNRSHSFVVGVLVTR